MRATEFYSWCDGQMPDAPHADVVVIDAEGFVHIVDRLYWDPEDARWVIRTTFPKPQEIAL